MNEPRPWEPAPEAAPVRPAPAPQRSLVESDVLVPLGQALLLATPTFLFMFLFTAGTADGDLLARLGPSFAAGGQWACAVFFAWSLWTIIRRQALWFLEDATGLDLNRDHSVGRPGRGEPVVIELHREDMAGEGKPPIQYIHTRLEYAKLAEVARLVGNGASLAHGPLTGKGKPLSRSELTGFQKELVSQGLATWKSEKAKTQGVDLTPAGRAMLRKYAHPAPNLPPAQSGT